MGGPSPAEPGSKMTTVIPFSSSFVTKYLASFNELLRIGSLAAQRKVAGKESNVEDDRAQRMLIVLLALSKPGLTKDEIESLEYCLHRLNETLTVPTVKSLFPFTFIPKRLNAYPSGRYTLSSPGVNLIYSPRQRLTLSMGVGSFSLIGKNANLNAAIHTNYSLPMGVGSFSLTGNPMTPSFVAATVTLQAELATEAFGAQHFLCDFNNGVDPHKQITVVGTGGYGTRPMHYGSSITVTVTKTTNGGIAQDVGHVNFSRNGVDEPGTGSIGSGNGVQNFSLGDNLGTGSIQYVYTGLSVNDVIRVTITEG